MSACIRLSSYYEDGKFSRSRTNANYLLLKIPAVQAVVMAVSVVAAAYLDADDDT